MTRCADFYAKWKRVGNFCEKNPRTAEQIDGYLDLILDLVDRGIPEDRAFAGLPEGAARPLLSIQDDEIRENAISHVETALKRETPTGGNYTDKLTSNDVKGIVERETTKCKLPEKPATKVATFNQQKNDNIEWARWSWNPVTGCKHGCPYCYARDFANRFYPEKFEPTFKPHRLDAPKNTNIPEQAKQDVGYKNVFVCSMADLFGDWVPKEWIDAVLKSVAENPQWNFLFLTKNPKRYLEFDFPVNSWIGTTVDCQDRVNEAERVFQELRDRQVGSSVLFLSCEPMLTPIIFTNLELWDWVIIGGSSGNSQTPAIQPEWEWVEGLLKQARDAFDGYGLSVYFKPNLTIRPREYPAGE